MELKFVKQKSAKDCGLAVSSMLINYYHKKNFSIEELRFQNTLEDSEMSLHNIEKLLEVYKIEFKSFYCEFEEFSQLDISNPVVVNILNANKDEHYVIVYKKKKNHFLVADPDKNDILWVKKEELASVYQGYFSTTSLLKRITFNSNKLISWYKLLGYYLKEILMILFISLFLNLSILLSNNFLKIYSLNIGLEDFDDLKKVFLAFSLLFVFQIVINFVVNKIIFYIQSDLNKRIFIFYKDKILSINIEDFGSVSKEEWLNKLKYINVMSSFIVQTTLTIPIQFVLFFMSLIMLSMISNLLLAIILLENLVSVFLSFVFFYFIRDTSIKAKRKNIIFGSMFREIIDGYNEIKFKKMSSYFSRNIENNFSEVNNISKLSNNQTSLNSLTSSLLSKFFFLVIFYISAYMITNNVYKFNELLFYISISLYINSFTNSLAGLIFNYQEIKIASSELKFIFDRSIDKKIESLNSKIISIKCENIYKFKNESCLIKNVSFEFNKNTFIKGNSGSGKTSLLKLISGNIQNFEGKVSYNNVSHSLLNEEKLTSKICYIGQYDYLFNDTVWKNLQCFQNYINIDYFKDMNFLGILESHNIDIHKTIVDNGSNLSKGQRQMINFLGLFFVEKEVYLIDEPLSNVDRKTARVLLEKFIESKKNSLIIMTDHNLDYQNLFEESLVL